MHKPLFGCFLTVSVFLGGEPGQSLLEEVNFQGVKARHKRIDSQIVLEAVDKVRIRDVLRDYEAWLPFYFLLASNNLDSTAARRCARLHDVHVLVVVRLSVHRELPEVVWEEVGLRAEIVLGKHPPHPAEILPHHVFPANLEGLREVVDLLVLGGFLKMLRLRLASPHDVPFRAVWPYNPASPCFQRVHHRVVDVGRFGDFEPESHVMLLEVLLLRNLHFLEWFQLCLARPVNDLEEGGPLLHGFRSRHLLRLHR